MLGVLLAKWTWLLIAPASPAMPAATWEASDEAERVFGTAKVADVSSPASLGNIKLIGVFAHRTKGFAVMQVDEKQIGVGLGDEVKPGVRLIETNTDHVILDRAGIRQRVDLTGAATQGVTGPAPSYVTPVPMPTAPAYTPPAPDNSNSTILSLPSTSHSGHPQGGSGGFGGNRGGGGGNQPPVAFPAGGPPAGQIEALQQKLDTMSNLPPEQREALKRQLDNLRGQH